MGVAKVVYDAQHGRRGQRQQATYARAAHRDADPRRDDHDDTQERQAGAGELLRRQVSTPMIPARTATRTGVEAMISALSPAGMV